MQENKDIFENSAAEALRNFEQEPPAGMWDRIDAGIKRRHRKILLIRYSSVAATLLILLSFGVYFLNEQSSVQIHGNQITQRTINPAKKDQEKKESATSSAQKKSVSGSTVTSKSNSSKSKGTSSDQKATPSGAVNRNVDAGKKSSGSSRRTDKIINNTHISDNNTHISGKETLPKDLQGSQTGSFDLTGTTDYAFLITEMPAIQGDFNTIQISIKPQLALKPVDLAYFAQPVYPEESASGDWSLALGYGMTSGSDLTQNEETFESRSSQFLYDDFSAQLANQTSFFEEIDNTIHDAPIAIGMIVGKGLSNRLSLETGITYTRLAFRIKTDDLSPFYRKYRNEMYYLGVPAGIRYSFLNREKFNLYALQWGVLEKGISGRWHIDTYNNNVITESESKHQEIRGVQFSTVTAAGGQYKLAGSIYLFGQAGIQVFYLNKTQPFNIRSTKNLWPSIQAGLRMDF